MIDGISYDDLDGRRGRRQETRVLDLIKIGRLFIKIIVLLGFLHHPLDSHGRGAVEKLRDSITRIPSPQSCPLPLTWTDKGI